MNEKIPQQHSHEGLSGRERVRVSVSNLVHTVRVRETGETHQIAMRNEKVWKDKGERKYQALGGAVKMTEEGKAALIATYGAEFGIQGRPAEEADDARFMLDVTEQGEEGVTAVMDTFSAQNPAVFEDDVLRETHEDLVSAGILTEEEFSQITARYEGAVSPLKWKETTSERETGTPSERIFHLFELEVPAAVFQKMRESESLHILTKEDIDAIATATEEGKPAARLPDGGLIVENIFPLS
jgi:hypothetical protein